ncbi:MAG: hypothetical protein NkDv07_0978 [Candidatus Improbicoccus devescovinae]|nr:MAG: hypothetical protein NkDv07_0978 [Candidatus Improbicoccus devescovinae]
MSFIFRFEKKKKQNDNITEPIFLRTANDNYEFITIKGVLEYNKIPYVTSGHGAESYLRIKTGVNLGRINFLVKNTDFERAKNLVDSIFTNDEKLEKMDDFFATRIVMYENHMLTAVEGLKEAYKIMAETLPKNTNNLLDLGCGTGLELDEIFKINPDVYVTGIDLTQTMLDKLAEKHPDKNLNLICGNYFDILFGKEKFDAAISFETLHHFTHDEKIRLYHKIFDAVKTNGCYIECDYMVEKQEEEDFYFYELKRLRKEQNIPDDELVHFDTPLTIENQIKLLKTVGFYKTKKIYKCKGTVILKATKL